MAAGFPGTFPGGLTTGERIIGAVQNGPAASAGFPGVFQAGLTTSLLTIGAVQNGLTISNITGTFTIDLTFSGAGTGIGQVSGATTITLSFSGTSSGIGSISGSTTLTLTFSGNSTGIDIEQMVGSATITLEFNGDLDGDDTTACGRYRCDVDIEQTPPSIVAAGYRLTPTLVGDCKRVRKS